MTTSAETERTRREAAYAARGDVVEGSAMPVEPRRLGQVVSLRLDAGTMSILREIAERRRASISDLLREGLAMLITSEQRTVTVTSVRYRVVSAAVTDYGRLLETYESVTGPRFHHDENELT
jgi:hypothetical protein